MMRLLLTLCGVLAASLAHAAIPATVGWHELANTSLLSVCPPAGGWPTIQGAEGCPGVIDDWNSGAMDTTRNRLIVWGGGHNGYYGNEIYAIDLDDQTRARLTDPGLPAAPFSPCQEANAGGAQPNSRHTFDGMAYIGSTADQLFVVSGSLACGNGTNGVSTWTYSFGTSAWQRRQDVPLLGWAQNDIEGVLAAYDQINNLVWVDTRVGMLTYNPADGTYTTRRDMGGHYRCQLQTMVHDPIRNYLYTVGCGQMWRWNISNLASVPAPTSISSTGATTCVSTGGPGLAWDSVQQRVTMWCGGATVYTLNHTTNAWTANTLSPSPGAANVNGTYKRFAYSQTSQVFIVINDMTLNAFAARLYAEQENFVVRCAQPGVVKCQNFDSAGDYSLGVKLFAGDGGYVGGSRDTTIKASGTASLKFTLPAGRATSDISGSWRDDLGSTFGEGSTFYAQYRVRISPTMRSNLAQWQSGTATGWKHVIFHHLGGASCASLELTGTIYQFSGGIATQVFYTECGNRLFYMSAAGAQSNSGPYIQQGTPVPPSTPTLGFRCDFNSLVDGTGNGTNCFNWQWTDEWLTFNWEVRIGTFGVANSTVKVTVTRDGSSTSWPLVWFDGNVRLDQNSVSQTTYGAVQFTPYMTGLSSSASSEASIWYDDFIVSTRPIALPGQAAAGGGGGSSRSKAGSGGLRLSGNVRF